MRRTLTTLAAAVALGTFLIGVVHSADEEELSTDLMQSIEDTNKSLASNIATQNAKGATSDAKELNEMFSQVETFYVHKSDAVDAVELARKSKNLSARPSTRQPTPRPTCLAHARPATTSIRNPESTR